MKIFLLLVGLTTSFNAISEEEKPEQLNGDPYFDYMVTCRSTRLNRVLACIDWVMMNLNKENGVVLHGFLNAAETPNSPVYYQSFRLENNLLFRKQGFRREDIKLRMLLKK